MKDQPKPKMNITIQNLNTKNIWGVEKKNSWNLVAFLVMFRTTNHVSSSAFIIRSYVLEIVMASVKGLNQKSCYNQTCIKRSPTVNYVVTPIKAILCHSWALKVQRLAQKFYQHWFRKINMDKLLRDRLFLVLSEWSHFKWPFSPGGVKYKQAVRTQ